VSGRIGQSAEVDTQVCVTEKKFFFVIDLKDVWVPLGRRMDAVCLTQTDGLIDSIAAYWDKNKKKRVKTKIEHAESSNKPWDWCVIDQTVPHSFLSEGWN